MANPRDLRMKKGRLTNKQYLLQLTTVEILNEVEKQQCWDVNPIRRRFQCNNYQMFYATSISVIFISKYQFINVQAYIQHKHVHDRMAQCCLDVRTQLQWQTLRNSYVFEA